MKKLAVYALLIIYALTFSEALQLLKMPVLVQHFWEHHEQDPQLSLARFLKLHYTGKYTLDEDYSKDQQLPFRTSNDLLNTVSFCELHFTLPVIAPHHFMLSRPVLLFKEDVQERRNSRDIFQPPRIS